MPRTGFPECVTPLSAPWRGSADSRRQKDYHAVPAVDQSGRRLFCGFTYASLDLAIDHRPPVIIGGAKAEFGEARVLLQIAELFVQRRAIEREISRRLRRVFGVFIQPKNCRAGDTVTGLFVQPEAVLSKRIPAQDGHRILLHRS